MTAPADEAYQGSTAVYKLQQAHATGGKLRIACLDIDSTLTGNPQDQLQLRSALEHHGYVIAFITARTSELCISWPERQKSSLIVQNRPKAKLKLDPHSRTFSEIDPAEIPGMTGLLDPDCLAATSGTELLLKQVDGGYHHDKEYMKVNSDKSDAWRMHMHKLFELIQKMQSHTLGHLSQNESAEHYFAGTTLVFPPENRVEIEFSSEANKNIFLATLQNLKEHPSALKDNDEIAEVMPDVFVTDESNPSSPSPAFKITLTPKNFTKKNAVDHMLEKITGFLKVSQSEIEILFAGDSPGDLAMGLESALEATVVFIIPGGARLTRIIKQDQHLLSQLKSTGPGHYQYSKNKRTIILGEEAFPDTKGPQTIAAWLEKNEASAP